MPGRAERVSGGSGSQVSRYSAHENGKVVNPTDRQPSVAYPGIFFGGGGVQQIQLRTEDREDGVLGAVAP